MSYENTIARLRSAEAAANNAQRELENARHEMETAKRNLESARTVSVGQRLSRFGEQFIVARITDNDYKDDRFALVNVETGYRFCRSFRCGDETRIPLLKLSGGDTNFR